MAIIYPGNPIGQDPHINLNIQQEVVPDVINAFMAIPRHPDYIFLNAGLIDNQDRYREYQRTHFQSIIRIRNSPYLILSGGDDDRRFSQLFIVKMATYMQNLPADPGLNSRLRRRAFGSNDILNLSKIDFVTDIKTLFHGKYWHGGGMDVFGNLLTIPIENMDDDTSRIVFIDVSNPEQPKLVPNLTIQRGAQQKGSAVGITRLSNGYFILGVWAYNNNRRRVDFYLSRTSDINDGFETAGGKVHTVLFDDVDNNFNEYRPEYQNICLVRKENDELYLIGTENATLLNPIHLFGSNRAHLYRIVLHPDTTQLHHPILRKPGMVYLGDRFFGNIAKQYNFDAGTGIYVTEEGTLAMYAITHYRKGNYIKMAEFFPLLRDTAVTHQEESIIELYEHRNFKGKCLRIYGTKFSKISNYNKIRVENYPFSNRVSSVRYLMPAGVRYCLYDNTDFKKPLKTLTGTGQPVEIRDLGTEGIGDKISSSQFV